jgi:2'-5' RNA ligase
MSAERMFVAIDPPPSVRERLAAAVARVRPLAPQAKWVDVATLHVTLAFLGNVDAERVPDYARALERAAAMNVAFELRFAGSGTLGGHRGRVLWAGVAGRVDSLRALERTVVAALVPLGFEPEERAFVPHLTLARARDPRGEPRFGSCTEALANEDFGSMVVDHIVLDRSVLTHGGPIHTPVASLPLQTLEHPR